jgi:Ca2+/Na+ antiporter
VTIVDDSKILIPVLILLGTVVAVIITFVVSQWRLTKGMGATFMLLYIGFVAYNIIEEVLSAN